MRALLELKNKRVDIKTPISARQKVEETPEELMKLIAQAVSIIVDTAEIDVKKLNFGEIANQVANGCRKGVN